MWKHTLRILFTILMYVGIVVFLVPYITGRISSGGLILLIGGGSAVIFGLLRCYCTEGDCSERMGSSPRI